MASTNMKDRLIVALDGDTTPESFKALMADLAGHVGMVKIGKKNFTRHGPLLVRLAQDAGLKVFLDLKFHDIPNTVAEALKAACDLGVDLVNVHAMGGRKMLEAARKAVPADGLTKLLAVTVLTSLNEEDLRELGIPMHPSELVKKLAGFVKECALDGVVCSALETKFVRHTCGDDFLIVTPGIRPESAEGSGDDQARIATPRWAVEAGSDYLVVGRPILKADHIPQAAAEIVRQMSEAKA